MTRGRTLAPLTAAVWLLACQAGDPPPLQCTHRSECPPGWTCGPNDVCIVAVACTLDSECCPGMTCFNGHCEPAPSCLTDAPCTGADRACYDDLCQAIPCQKDSECTAPNRCIAGVCVGGAPCGGCAEEEACVVELGRCVPAKGPCAALKCDPGTVRVVRNAPTLAEPSCHLELADCACAPLPPLAGPMPGYFGGLVALGKVLLHASYDPTYGDVVVSRFEAVDGTATLEDGPTAVDGLPEDATVVGDVSGPRKGIEDPGPDMGRYLSAAGRGSFLYLAYRDDTHSALRFAVVKPDKGNAAISYTLASDGDPGTFTSVAADAAGAPRVVSYLRALDGKDGLRTGLGLWRAGVANPSETGNWIPMVLVDSAPAVQSDSKIEGLPKGVGLFPSAAVTPDGVTWVAYYDSLAGDLRLGHVSLAGAAASVTIDGSAVAVATGTTTADVGRHARLSLRDDGSVAIAYQDATDQSLRFYAGSTDGSGEIQVADDGMGHRVGAGIALAFTSSGEPVMVHGDETTSDLRVTRRVGGTWSTTALLTDGVQGMFPSAVRVGDVIYVSALELRFPSDATPHHELHVLALPTP